MPIFDSIFHGLPQKKFSLKKNPWDFWFSFQEYNCNQSQLFSILVKKYLILFVWLMHIHTYAPILQCNSENQTTSARGCTSSLSAHRKISIPAHFPFLTCEVYFFFNYYCYSSEEDTLPTTWKDNDPQKPNENIEIHTWKGHFLIVRMWHFIKTLPLFSSPGLVLLSVKVVYFLKIIFFILYLHGSVYILLLKKTCFGEKRSVKLWNQALN